MLLAVVATLAGCASIPESSEPKPARDVVRDRSPDPPLQPPRGSDPLTLVRKFVEANGNPVNEYAAARQYLVPETADQWNPSPVTVIADGFDTVYSGTFETGANADGSVTVTLRGRRVGRLAPDHTFVPESGEVELELQLRKLDGEWRISEPPGAAILTYSSFSQNYTQVPIYFLHPDRESLVPDLRYVQNQPATAQPNVVVDMLLRGPSFALEGAVRTAIPEKADIRTNVAEAPDGALVVDLTGVDDQPPQRRQLMAAQIVLSLQPVTNSRVRLLSDNVPLLSGQEAWRPSDFLSYLGEHTLPADLPGLVVAGGRLYSMEQGKEVPGPAGRGDYSILSAALSADGRKLAAVTTGAAGPQLRVGNYGEALQEVSLQAERLTRPSWRSGGGSDRNAGEVWTVADGTKVVSVFADGRGGWTTRTVNAAELTDRGEITELRLSRDGVRVAAVVDGQLWVGSVVDDGTDASVTNVRQLLPGALQKQVTSVDWRSAALLLVGTSSNTLPVLRVSVDGKDWQGYPTENLTPPVTVVAAAPGRPVVVADSRGLWTTPDDTEYWNLHAGRFGPGSVPFYPG